MIDLVKKYFGKRTETVSKDPSREGGHDVSIATCALFLEMAKTDGEFSDSEQESIIAILRKDYDLSEECAAELLDASNEELKRSIDLWQFTNRINENYSTEEKIRIVEMIWKIAYADGILDKHEDYLVHKLANLFRLTHKQLIDVKLKVIQHNC